ncbi:MAG: SBBP repeat-containing protein [Acidobacteriia bacterium]|nr:SBBP repeat-containing protein [Terriglobia bacterium]
MRPRLFVKLLWSIILVVIAIFINRQVEAAEPTHPNSSDKILQFTSSGHILGFGAEGVYVASGSHALRVQFVNARNSNPVSNGSSNSAVPGDKQHATPLSQVTYANLWDGVTLTYDAPSGAVLRSSYRIDAFASLENVRLRYNAPVSVESDGSLRISFQAGAMNESAPQAWQEREGKRVPTMIAFSQRGKDEIGFVVGKYDPGKPLFIDPALTWNTFLGGSGEDWLCGVAVDGSGNVYVAGNSDASWGSPVRAYGGGIYDAFAAKLDPGGNLIWNTFLGGSGDDEVYGLAVDGSGNVYVAGSSTASWGLPIRAYNAGDGLDPHNVYDAFVVKLDSSGNLIWNTFLGGSSFDEALGVAVDGSGNVYVAGDGWGSWGSPLRAYSNSFDVFAAKLGSGGNLIWNTFLGGSGIDYGLAVAVDGSGSVYVAGDSAASWGSPVRDYGGGKYDAFAAKLNSSGNLIWNTFLGGSGDDQARWRVAVDGSGNVYVAGLSDSSWGSPVRPYSGNYDAYAAKLDSGGNLLWSTFLGGGAADYGEALEVDGSGNVYVAGVSEANWGSPLRAYGGGRDAYAAKLDSSGNLVWNIFLGGNGDDQAYGLAVDGSGNVYVAGSSSANWSSPVHAHGGGIDAFVTKISDVQVVAPPAPLPGNGGITQTSLGQGSLLTAYGQITTTAPTLPVALANFGYTPNGILTTEAGVAASAPTTAARVFVDYSAAKGTDSGVAVVNPSNNPITLNVHIRDTQGNFYGCPEQTVTANGHLAMFASQLCPSISNLFLGTLTLSSSTAFAATNLMLGTNAHGEPLYNSLPVAIPPVPPAGNNLYFSQFVDGGGYSTALLLMNLTGTPISGTVSFWDDNGHAVTLNFGPSIGSRSTLNYSIPGNGMLKFTTTGLTPGTSLHVGFVVVTSTSGALPSGAVIFSSYNGTGGLASQAGVLNSPVTSNSRMYVEKSNSPLPRDTGVAIVNPNSSAATLQLNLVSLDGSFTAVNTITLPANAHLSAFVGQSALMGASASSVPANFQGVLTLSSNLPITPVTLRLTTNQRREDLYSTLPVADLNNPPTGPLYLPQIADGGGYATQIILVNTGSGSGSVTMNFFNDIGGSVQIATTASSAQTIIAARGGTIALPNGSSVTIPPGALTSDQALTLSLAAELPQQPPSGFIVGVGYALVLSTSTPPFRSSTGNIEFVINAGTNTSGLEGSAGLADLIDSTGDNFFGVTGTFDASTSLERITVSALLMDGTNRVVVSMGNLSSPYAGKSAAAVGTTRNILPLATANVVPPIPGNLSWNGSAWGPYSGCSAPPGTRVLVLVHGILSSVEDAYGNNSAMVTALDGTTDFCVNQIQKAAGKNSSGAPTVYGQVVGFDYDWSSDIGLNSGPSFANFLNTLARCGNEIDVQAHSAGGPVASYGIMQAAQETRSLIKNFVGLGNPWTGTQAAFNTIEYPGFMPLLTELVNFRIPFTSISLGSSVRIQGRTVQDVLNAPFVPQLEPWSPLLLSIQQDLGQKAPQLNMVLACGTQPQGLGLRFTEAVGHLFGTANDGIVSLDSCQGVGPRGTGNVFTGINPRPLLPYSLSHTQLACDPHVIADVGRALRNSPPVGPFTLSIRKAGSGIGTVTADPPGLSYNPGTILTLTATPDANSVFAVWSGDCSEAGACVLTMDSDKSVTATFNLKTSFTLTMAKVGSGNGTVIANPPGPSYAPGTIVALTATPDANSTFAGWSGACSGSVSCTVTMNQNQSVTATFNLKTPTETWVGSYTLNWHFYPSSNCSNMRPGFIFSNSGIVTMAISKDAEGKWTGTVSISGLQMPDGRDSPCTNVISLPLLQGGINPHDYLIVAQFNIPGGVLQLNGPLIDNTISGGIVAVGYSEAEGSFSVTKQ